jgi:uncharacterized spore protein YtfJ
MEFNAEQLLDKLSEVIKSEVKTETIIGQQFTLGEFTCVPVVKAGIGFGSGGGNGEAPDNKGKGTGGGAGAGLGLAPVGFLVTKGSDISFISTEKTSGLSKVFEQVPELITKLMEKKAAKEEAVA